MTVFPACILWPQLAALSQHALGPNLTPNKHSSFLHRVTFCEIIRLYIYSWALHSSVMIWWNKGENASCSSAFLAFNAASQQHDLSSCIMDLANGLVVQIWSFYLCKSSASLIGLVIWPCLCKKHVSAQEIWLYSGHLKKKKIFCTVRSNSHIFTMQMSKAALHVWFSLSQIQSLYFKTKSWVASSHF